MSLKTKGFSRETEALIWIGGGENRTLVLSKLHNDDYMLSAFFNKLPLPESAPLGGNQTVWILNSHSNGPKPWGPYQDV